MSAARRLVADALDALAVHSPSAYSWLGQTFVRSAGDDDPGVLVRAIQQRLYSDFYLPGRVTAPRPQPAPHRGPWPSRVVREMSAANAGTGSPMAGWRVVAVEDGALVVERDELRLWADRSDVVPGLQEPEVGTAVVLRVPKEVVGRPGGFYSVYGDAGADADATAVDRFYWSVRAAGRVPLVRQVTSRLNEAGVPFRFKVLADPGVMRCDAAVLYCPASWRREVSRLLRAVVGSVDGWLLDRTPALTLRVAAGVGFAEHPPGAESFGTDRCRLLADAVVRAHAAGLQGASARMEAVEAAFADAGLTLDSPHLNHGSRTHDDPVLAA